MKSKDNKKGLYKTIYVALFSQMTNAIIILSDYVLLDILQQLLSY